MMSILGDVIKKNKESLLEQQKQDPTRPLLDQLIDQTRASENVTAGDTAQAAGYPLTEEYDWAFDENVRENLLRKRAELKSGGRDEQSFAQIEAIDAELRAIDRIKEQYAPQRYASVKLSDDFETYSKPAGSKLSGLFDFSGDRTYDYINDIDGYRMKHASNSIASIGASNMTDYQYMSEDEIGIYNYLYAKEGKKSADAFLEYIKPGLSKRRFEQTQENARKFAQDNPVTASVLSIPANLAGGVASFADLAGQGIKGAITGKPVDFYSQAQGMGALGGSIRSEVSEMIEKNSDFTIGDTNVASFLYNTGMSSADSLLAGLGGVWTGRSILGSSAAASMARDIHNRGGTDTQAFLGGLAAGVFEALFEGISIGNFKALQEVPVSSIGDFVKNIAKSMGVNASEESATELANILFDTLAMGDISNWEYAVRELMSQGYSEDEAKRITAMNMTGQVIEAGASGALMGAGFGGISSAVSGVNTRRNGAALRASGDDAVQAIIDTGLESAEGTVSRRVAEQLKEKLEKGEKLSDYQLGRLYGENVKAIAKEKDEAVRKWRQAANERLDALSETADDQLRLSLPRGDEVLSRSSDTVHHSFGGYDEETGRGIYEGNFPKGTPRAAKAERILHYIQNVWSKKPIDLVITNTDGTTRNIQAHFDPTYTEDENIRTDASKLMAGNRHGSAAEQRVTLDLADDYYQIASEAAYNYSKDETGKTTETHKGVKQWHYFINDILFREQGETQLTPYRVTINVKEKDDGHFVYSFNAEKQNERPSTRRTLHADVNPSAESAGANAQPYVNSIRQSSENVNDFERENISGGKGEAALDTQAQAGYNELTNNIGGGAVNGSGEMGDGRVRRRVGVENTGKRIAESVESGGIFETGSAQAGLRLHAGGSGQTVYAQDSEGRRLTQEQTERIDGTSVVDENGNPLAVYHFTPNMEFKTFTKGDIGFHFGTFAQARQRSIDLGSAHGRIFRTYLNIKNPVQANQDFGSWRPRQLGLYLWSEGYLTDSEWHEIKSLEGYNYDSPAATMLREILESKGYDGVVYPNGIEGAGDSYIAFRNDQIVQTDILPAPSLSGGTEGAEGFGRNGRKAYHISERSGALDSVIRRLNRGESVPVAEIMATPEIAAAERANEGTPTIELPNREDVRRRGYKQAMEKGSWDGEDYRGPVRRQRRMDIVIGLPRSGKSSVYTERLSREYGARVIDTDDFREYIPEYDGTNASVVHEEASEIKQEVLETVLRNGDNILLSTIGADAEKLAEDIKSYVEIGYSVYLHLNELQNSKAMARALSRYVRSDGSLGRYVSPRLIAHYGDAPTQTYRYLTGQGGTQNGRLGEALRRDGEKGIRVSEGIGEENQSGASSAADLLAGYDWYNNDVGYGEKPRLIESSQESENNAEQDSSSDASLPRDDGTVRLPTWEDIERQTEHSKKPEADTASSPKKASAEATTDESGKGGKLHKALDLPLPERWQADRVGSDKKTPMRLSEIVEKIRHDFGLNITAGHIRGRGVLGQYDDKSRGIRTKIAQNLPTVAHELGHHFDNLYVLSENLTEEQVAELHDNLSDGTKALYKKDEWTSEGIAEFLRKFLQNRETTAIDYPLFTDYFLKALSSKDLALIEQLADEVNAYYSMDADTVTSSIRLREEGAPDARTPFEKLRTHSSAIYQAWFDTNHAIKLFDQATGANTYKLASNSAYADAMAGQILIGDLTDANGQYVAPGLHTALHGLDMNDEVEYRLFGEYLAVKHGPERLAEGMRVFADDRKNSTAFMNRRQAELEAQYPQFEEISDRLYKYIQQFYQTWGVETGLIGDETLKKWRERWKYYVPFNRAVSKDGRRAGAKRGFANQNSTVRKALGSGLDIVHPVDNLVDNIVKMVNAGVRNNVMRKITDSALELGADALFMEQVPAPLKVTQVDLSGVKDSLVSLLEESDLDAKSKAKAGGIVSSLDDILFQYGRGKAYGDVITVLKNGKPEFWKINDPQLLSSLTNLVPKSMEGILDAYAVLSRFMTANITGNNLIWAIFSNMPRDLMTTMTYSKNKNVAKLIGGVAGAYINKVKGDNASPLYKEYLAMGGGNISAYTADRDLAKRARKKLSGKKLSANPMDWLAFVGDTVESGPRFATYKLMREAGLDPQEAFYEAMDITVNFRRGGRLSRELNKVVPFFNANMQGLDKFRRWLTAEEAAGNSNRKKVVAARTISFLAVSAALAAVSYALNNSDDEKEKDYEQLSTYIKNSYWNIPLGDGKYFSIPKPREIGVVSSFFETLMEYGIGDNSHAFDEFYAYAAENCLPAIVNDIAQVGDNGLVETGMNILGSLGVIGVVGYLGANRDFLGRPIVSSGLERLEPEDQYTASTSKIAYWLGQAFGGSPQQIDYAMQQILGGWWKYQKALFPVGSENRDWTLGVGNTYIKDNQYSTDLVNWMYDRADVTAAAYASDEMNINKAIAAKWDDNMKSFYGSYNTLAKDEAETVASRGARQLVLDMIYEYRKGIDNGTTTAVQDAVEAVCKSRGDTDCLPAVMAVEVTDGNGNRHMLSDVQYVEFQTDYLRLYWEAVEEALSDAATSAEKAAILLKAKEVAKEEAVNRTLARIGAKQTDYFEEYSGMSSADIIDFKAQRYLANEDGSIKQDEIIDIIQRMILDGLNDDDAYALYISEYTPKSETAETGYNKDGKMNVYGVRDAGVDAEIWLEFKEGLNNLEYEKGENGARQEAIIELLDSMGLDDETYDILYSTEYKSDSIFG